jgi:hypothetical protein
MGDNQFFNFNGADVFAASYDNILYPAGYPDFSGGINRRLVTGPEKAIPGERLLVFLRGMNSGLPPKRIPLFKLEIKPS